MSEPLRILPEGVHTNASVLASLGEQARCMQDILGHCWSRLDHGWEDYGESGIQRCYSNLMNELCHMIAMLKQMDQALICSVDGIEMADKNLVTMFERMAGSQVGDGGGRPPGLARPIGVDGASLQWQTGGNLEEVIRALFENKCPIDLSPFLDALCRATPEELQDILNDPALVNMLYTGLGPLSIADINRLLDGYSKADQANAFAFLVAVIMQARYGIPASLTNLPAYQSSNPPPMPPIVSRQAWEAREPEDSCQWIPLTYAPISPYGIPSGMPSGTSICVGTEEGFYDAEDNPGGYASYAELQPGSSLGDILNTVVIHHSGNNASNDPRDVQWQHMAGEDQYADVGYHYMIAPDGTIYEGRDIGARGAHVAGANTGAVGILIMGDFQPGPWYDINGSDSGPTPAQLDSAESLIRWLDYEYGIDVVAGHRDINDTQCPGENFPQSTIDGLDWVAQER